MLPSLMYLLGVGFDNRRPSWATLGECYREKLERGAPRPAPCSLPCPPCKRDWDTFLISSSGVGRPSRKGRAVLFRRWRPATLPVQQIPSSLLTAAITFPAPTRLLSDSARDSFSIREGRFHRVNFLEQAMGSLLLGV